VHPPAISGDPLPAPGVNAHSHGAASDAARRALARHAEGGARSEEVPEVATLSPSLTVLLVGLLALLGGALHEREI
jgi:hypothetical protein